MCLCIVWHCMKLWRCIFIFTLNSHKDINLFIFAKWGKLSAIACCCCCCCYATEVKLFGTAKWTNGYGVHIRVPVQVSKKTIERQRISWVSYIHTCDIRISLVENKWSGARDLLSFNIVHQFCYCIKVKARKSVWSQNSNCHGQCLFENRESVVSYRKCQVYNYVKKSTM